MHLRLPLLAPALVAALLAAVPIACVPEPEPEPGWTTGFTADESFGLLLSVWGPSPTEVYAVGGNPGAGAMARFDGEAWTEDQLPDGFPRANWVHGFAEGDASVLWVSGEDGQVARRAADGSWTTMDLGTSGDLWGIWGPSDDDVYAIGGDVVFGDPADGVPVLAHWDGATWTLLDVPDTDREFDALFKAWGTGPNDVFVIGRFGVILHWDGAAWTQQLAGTNAHLISLWGTGADELVAVGGAGSAVIARYDGASWTSATLDGLPGLNGVWLDADGAGLAVGLDGFVVEIPAQTFEFTELDRSAYPDVLHGAFGFADGTRFGVGGNLNNTPPWTGVIVQYLP